ncbi:MAG: DUF1816 domain-containing protein [Leptolyngbyaceae cyanobacterium SM1_1_3]|nr:DUF1816 domain-containing protein [Leptolyngbyaceae cyanobacterium SM1_1_3]NJN01160.1 DUF1816 domain-containing protein [Leptolyngbyaceae cyanobacterium RM1_1_2]NJO09261.1 DUF1816 domain-containing protein [Leptolyngbyaceae cyanobacterium SL_1_1]
MSLIGALRNFFSKLAGESDTVTQPWWLQIITDQPTCIYYFGPFASPQEAQRHQAGYIDDLSAEGARVFPPTLVQGNPPELTIEGETAKQRLTQIDSVSALQLR